MVNGANLMSPCSFRIDGVLAVTLWQAIAAWLPLFIVVFVVALIPIALAKWILPALTHVWRAERELAGKIELSELKSKLYERGFHLDDETAEQIVFKRRGTQLTLQGEKLPLRLAFRLDHSAAVSLVAEYDTWVLFDTGDLRRFADRLIPQLTY
jgi:hypothetical protein